MIRPNLILDLNSELIVDNFAGGGGASTGIERALGRHVDHAINHDSAALGMHRINHAQTVHHCEDVFDVDPAELTEGRPVGMGWFSPDCKHFSKAKGGKPLSKKIRGLAFVILRWAKIRTRVIYMENVEEIQTWGPLLENGKPDPQHKGRTWQAFKAALSTGLDAESPDMEEILEVLGNTITRAELERGFGYEVQTRELRACDYGAPTIRKRLFLIARCDGLPIHWPEPTHFGPKDLPAARQRIGRTAKSWVPVSTCIDWDISCHSIFLSKPEAKRRGINVKRPLAPSTLRRIATGIDRYVLKAAKPFLVSLTHQGGDNRVEALDEPAKTLTGAHRGEKALVAPSLMRHFGQSVGQRVDSPAPTVIASGQGKTALVNSKLAPFLTEHANASNQRNVEVNKPMPTQCAEVKGGHFALVGATVISKHCKDKPTPIDVPIGTASARDSFAIAAANIVKFRGNPETHPPAKDPADPLDTVSSGGLHHGVSVAYLAQHNGGFNNTPGHEVTEPISTVSAKGSQQQGVSGNLVAYYGNDKDGQSFDDPARTVTVRERFGHVQTEAVSLPSEEPKGLTPEQIAGAQQVAAFLRDHGVIFEGEFATLTVDGVNGQCATHFVIVDIGMRMLTARELFRAQGFGNAYIIDKAWLVDPHTGEIKEQKLTKEQQIRMCGNSVCPDVAEAIVRANSFDLSIWRLSERKVRAARAMAAAS